VLLFAQFSHAQDQGDIFIGGGSLLSSGANATFPAERGGLYLNIGGDVVFYKRLGVNVETAWRATQGVYFANDLNYRPILTDFNLLYQPRLGKKLGADLLAGIGSGDTRFYEPGASVSGYANYVSTDHFMEHLGAGVRFYPWKHIFVRPEIHYYHVQNNNSLTDNGYFSTNNLFRVGASIGYTIGGGQ
jgi:opacity protein-like surface antigen